MKKNTNKVIENVAILILSLFTTIALAYVSHYGITGIELLLPCVFVLCIIAYKKAISVYSKKDFKYTISLGAIVSVLTVLGSHIDMDERVFNTIGLLDIIYVFVLIPFFTSVFVLLFFSSDVYKVNNNVNVESNLKKRFFFCMGVMLVTWLPYYLTYYPGGIGNDIFECINMCNGTIPLTNHHPVIFTAILKVYMTIFGFTENPTLALGMMSLSQMFLLASTLATILIWLYKRGAKAWFWYISLAFFSLHPMVAIYSIYVTKDVLFACIVIFLTLQLYDFVSKDKHELGEWIKLGLLSLLTIMTRNNGVMMVVALAIVMLILVKKERKFVLVSFALVFILNGLYKGPIWKGLGIEKQSFVEAASIPLSQIAYTICQDGVISDENREYLESIMPFDRVKEEYEPGYTDSYKFSQYFNKEIIDNEPGKLIKVWFDMLPKNFGRYVEVYLMQTSGYWNYGVSNTVATEGVAENDVGVVGHNLLVLPLDKVFAKLLLIARKLPVLCMLSQMSIEILAVILCCVQAKRKKRDKYILCLIPLLALWFSILIATPAYCLFRYMCPVFFLWPVIITEFFVGDTT